MRMPAGISLPVHRRTGAIFVHTLRGAWLYIEHDWIAPAGDTIEVFLTMVGELFLDEHGQLLATENRKTSIERYAGYCAEHGIEQRDITSFGS